MSAWRARCVGIAVLVGVIESGCSTQARRVECEGQLEPINQSAPKLKDALSQGPTSSDSTKRRRR